MTLALRPADTVVVMTNCAFEGFHDRLLEALGQREAVRCADGAGNEG
jgi:hypothetical protein